MPRCLMAKKWKAAPATELGDETDEEIDVVGDGRGRSPAPAATAPGPPPRDPEPTLLYNADDLQAALDKLEKNFEGVVKCLLDCDSDDLSQTFEKMKEAGKNNVDGLVKWMQESGVIDKAKETEEKVKSYFKDVVDKNNVPVEKFNEAVEKIANDQKKNIDDLSKVLNEHGNKFLGALQAGASAFKDAMAKK